MASSSSSPPHTVFSSFHGPDARDSFLSHLRKEFKSKGIIMFDDQGIKRGETIEPALIQAIKASRISIVVLTKNYASSGWCLGELLEILKCMKDTGQIVIPVFHGVKPSDVRNKTGDFWIAFNKTCARKMHEGKRQIWSQALEDVCNITGEHFQKRDNEANMIEKIASYVFNQLNDAPSRDFDDKVGLEAHLRQMESLLDLKYNGVKMVGITGPAGIGKTTIARALQSRFSTRFMHTCFMNNLRESYQSGIDDLGLQLDLQEKLLPKLLNHNDMTVSNLGVLPQTLKYLNVFIILDDVNDVKQLDALAKEPTWFGLGSRIVVTTEKEDLLQQHKIDNTYHVGYPSAQEALEILCVNAFKQNSPPHGFEGLAERTTELCGRLPLALRVVGSSLRENKDMDEWRTVMSRLETSLKPEIMKVLRVGYDCLEVNEKKLFLHIAVFFNDRDDDLVIAMFSDSKFDVMYGLKILEKRSLIERSYMGDIVMHRLLQQMGKEANDEQKPWKRTILTDAWEIRDVLEDAKGTIAVSGISFDTSGIHESGIHEVSINERAFKKLPNLRFLRVYKSKYDGNGILNIPEEMELPQCLRLLEWEAYPSKCLPPRLCPEYLVELIMTNSKLEKLWDGIKELTSLKKMDLSGSLHLKELPDLSKATNLENLSLFDCKSLVALPDSYSNLQKLWSLYTKGCLKLEVIPTNWNLKSLGVVEMGGCSRLANFPSISENIHSFVLSDTAVEEVPTSITLWSHLNHLEIRGNEKLKTLPQLPMNITWLDLGNNGFTSISDCCIKSLRSLKEFTISGSRKLTSLPELPPSLKRLDASDCESLETVSFNSELTEFKEFKISGCRKLKSLPQLPPSLEYLDAHDCESLETVSYNSELAEFIEFTISGCRKLKSLPQLPSSLEHLDAHDCESLETVSYNSEITGIQEITISGCRKLKSLPQLPSSLKYLDAHDCESLKTVSIDSDFVYQRDSVINFANCFKLDEEARRAIIQDSTGVAILPGTEVPAEFNHRAMGNTLSFTLPAFSTFKVCLVISPNELTTEVEFTTILCRRIRNGYEYPDEVVYCQITACQTKHLCVFYYEWLDKYMWKVSREIMVEFSSDYKDFDIIECGAQILTIYSDAFVLYEFDTDKDEEDYKSESAEAHKDEDEGITEGDYESVSRKMTMTSDSTNPKCGIKRKRT